MLGAGSAGKRKSLPNSRIMIHQPLGGAAGQAADIEIQVRLWLKASVQVIRFTESADAVPRYVSICGLASFRTERSLFRISGGMY